MSVTTRAVPMDGLTPDDLARWRDLAARAAEPNVFFEPELLVPAVRALARPGSVRLLVVADGDGRWTACAPVHRVAAWGRLRLPCTAIWACSRPAISCWSCRIRAPRPKCARSCAMPARWVAR